MIEPVFEKSQRFEENALDNKEERSINMQETI